MRGLTHLWFICVLLQYFLCFSYSQIPTENRNSLWGEEKLRFIPGVQDVDLLVVHQKHSRLDMNKYDRWQENDKTILACPEQCRCYESGAVNCSRLGLSKIPALPSNVTNLDLSFNKFQTIEEDTFSGLPNLTQIDFTGNNFNDYSIKPKSFRGTSQLQTIYFGSNDFTRVPEHLPREVVLLNFYGNKITTFASSYLTNYTKLRSLALSQNSIRSIPPNMTALMPNLTDLDVSFNKITNQGISSTTFNGKSKLQLLSMRFNEISRIPEGLPASLNHFDLVGNPFTVVPSHIFHNLTQLITVELWASGLTTIEDNAFSSLHKLTILDVMECHVSSAITNQTFNGLISAQTIDLSLSKISIMEAGALNGLTKLQTLWLNDNPFKTLDPLLFSNKTIPSISEIYLWGSHWVCDCKLKWLKEMQESSSIIQDPHLMICAEPSTVQGYTWDMLSSKQFVC